MVEATEIAWAAGFYDGEGCTGLQVQRRRNLLEPESGDYVYEYLQVQVGQNHIELLERFRDAVGDSGNIHGPYRSARSANDHYTFQATGTRAEHILNTLWPYLSEPKKVQALSKGFEPWT